MSKRRWRGWLLLCMALAGLGACATGEDPEVRRLRARAAYEQAATELCLQRPLAESCEPRISIGLASLQEAINLNSEEPLYQATLGFVQLNLKNLPGAIEAFNKALALKPDYAYASHHLGVALAEVGQWEEALKAYQKTLAIPTYVHRESVHNAMGWAYYNLGRLGEAENALLQALRLEPGLQAAHYHLGLVLLKAGRPDEARGAFRRARELGPDSDFGRAARQHLKALGEAE